ncbi:MAG: HEAT repeat domain-containing protein [Steroidobacteraceae bacterium]
MKLNAELALQQLGFGWWDGRQPKLDISAALPALMDRLTDPHPKVRWSAEFDIAAIGPRADKAVPKLIALLSNSDEGTRGNACIALGHIGMAASDALPALRERLVDPSPWVRKVARFASARIKGKHPSLVVD